MIKVVIIPNPTAKKTNPAGKAGVTINTIANMISANMIAMIIIKILFNTIMTFNMPDTMML